jgi:hypothetical protein
MKLQLQDQKIKKALLILHTDNYITIHSATEYDEKSGIIIYG